MTSNAAKKTLSVPQQAQKWNYTCWASCASMTSAYFKGNKTNYESSILKYVKGSSVNGNSPSAMGTVLDIEKGVRYKTGKSGSCKATVPSYTAIRYQINNNGPMVVGLSKKAHAITLKGYNESGSMVLYNDPATGKGHSASYSYLTKTFGMRNHAFWK